MNNQLRLLLDVNPEPMWMFDQKTFRFLEVNDAAVKKYGYTRAALLKMTALDLRPAEEHAKLKRSVAALRGSKVKHLTGFKHKHKSGRVIEVDIDTHLVTWKGRKAVLSVIHDVTHQRTVESALRGAERASIDGMAVLDGRKRYVYLNDAYAQMYGFGSTKDLDGKPWRPLCPSREAKRFESEIMAGVARAGSWRGESTGRRRDGTEFPQELSLTAIAGGGFVCVARDVTQRKQAEAEHDRLLALERVARAEAEAANRAKDEFLAVLSHELRTPMTAVLGWTWLLRSGDVEPGEQVKALEVIERNMRLQAQIIEDLLDVSSIITGKIALEPRPIRVDGVVNAAIESLKAAADARFITVEANLEPLTVNADSQRLQQVFWNLVSNAVKFNRESGKVVISARADGGQAVISVEDTGEGLSPDFLSAAFDPFRQQESSLTRKHRGLGLGLAIVRHLVELHGGGVSVTSGGQGEGATFTVVLPLSERGSAARDGGDEEKRQPASRLPHTLDGLSVLIVDDEADTLTMLGELLRFCGAEVRTAISPDDAFKQLRKKMPDVLVSDIAMPGEDGYSLLKRVREMSAAGRNLPALALTARAKDDDRLAALDAGYQLWLAKPAEPRKLVAGIRRLAGRPELA